MKPIKVLLVNNTVLPAAKYGGTERVLWWLGKALQQQGHEVAYLAAPGSRCPFAAVYPYSSRRSCLENLRGVKTSYHLIHFHFPLAEEVTKQLPTPHLFTLHGMAQPEEQLSPQTVFLSKRQAELFGGAVYVHNGVDFSEYEEVDLTRPRRGFCFLAHGTRREKNLAAALRIAAQAGERLEVMGQWRFRWGDRVRYHGMVGDAKKKSLLSRARALLFPVLWEEPFGLAVVEALLCGTPVLGTRYGALPELVTPKVGRLTNEEAELSAVAKKLTHEKTPVLFSPVACRAHAKKYFSSTRMATEYVRLYRKCLAGEKLHPLPLYLREELLKIAAT